MKRSLAFWPLVATILCCVSGGPFGLEPIVQSGIGMSVLLVLVTPIVWSLPAALMTAELSSALPDEGGYYVWVRRALGPFWGFLCGWWSWVFTWVDVAIYPVLFATYIEKMLALFGYGAGFADHPWITWGIGLTMIAPLVWLNIRGIKLVGDSSILFFALITLPFVVLVLFGLPQLFAHPSAAIHPFLAPGKTRSEAFSAGLFVAMWNYLGWDTLTTVAGEFKTLAELIRAPWVWRFPRSRSCIYFPSWSASSPYPPSRNGMKGPGPMSPARSEEFSLAVAVTAAGLVSAAGMFSSILLAGSRIPFVMAEDRILPPSWTKLHPRYGTPWVAILISAFFYALFSFGSFKDLAEVDVIVYSAGLVLEFVALVVLRFREPTLERPFRIPGGWVGIVLICLLPMAILAAAINDQIHGESRLLAQRFTLIALASGPAVWLASKGLRRIGNN